MPLKRCQRAVCLASVATLLLVVNHVKLSAQEKPPAPDVAAAERARDKCDRLASHPHDPGRYAAPVPDDQFATGAAIEACEAAVKLNPDLARLWFQLGRSYRMGQRDKDAFKAFIEAAHRKYAPALKFIGDAYLEGRGLPDGESQSAQIAMTWYQKSADGGFQDGAKAVQEVQDSIKKKQADVEQARLAREAEETRQAIETQKAKEAAEREKFDPSIFQNPAFMSSIYNGNGTLLKSRNFIFYVSGFTDKIGGTEPLFINGQSCFPQIAGTTTSVLLQLIAKISLDSRYDEPSGFVSSTYSSNFIKFTDQGERDSIALFNRYGCDGKVTHAIIENINAYFDPSRRKSH